MHLILDVVILVTLVGLAGVTLGGLISMACDN